MSAWYSLRVFEAVSKRVLVLLPTLAATLVGLAGCQSYESGMQLICEAPKHCEPCKSQEGSAQLQALQKYIDTHLRNEDAKQALLSLKDAPVNEQGKQLRRMATEAGIAGCAMADVMDAHTPSSGGGALPKK
ncbi:MAG: hypothetical protein AAF721_22370 [Myxococcota bacterium]